MDMKHRMIDWAEHKEYCKHHDIKAINFPILDVNAEDMAAKAHDAATLLHELILKYHVKSREVGLEFLESLCALYSRNWKSTSYCCLIFDFFQTYEYR
jgi:hypothetical protein